MRYAVRRAPDRRRCPRRAPSPRERSVPPSRPASRRRAPTAARRRPALAGTGLPEFHDLRRLRVAARRPKVERQLSLPRRQQRADGRPERPVLTQLLVHALDDRDVGERVVRVGVGPNDRTDQPPLLEVGETGSRARADTTPGLGGGCDTGSGATRSSGARRADRTPPRRGCTRVRASARSLPRLSVACCSVRRARRSRRRPRGWSSAS